MRTAYIALGSNLKNPIAQIRQAIQDFELIPNTQVIKASSLYQTTPIDCVEASPDFINAVVEVDTLLSPAELLDALLEVENKAGRERPYPNAPRVLDCDLLLYENEEINTSQLTLPHPRMHTRGFVLLPLFEIAPHLSLANHGKIALLINEQLLTGIKKLNS